MENQPDQTGFKKHLRETGIFILDVLYNAVIIIILVVVIRSFIISPFRVVGSSMADTLQNKEFILIDKLSYTLGDIDRGDPVVFRPPATSKDKPKFEEVVTSDETGVAQLDLNALRGDKDSPYCENSFLGAFWFCTEKPDKYDLVYYAPQERESGSRAYETQWDKVESITLSRQDLKNEVLEIQGDAETNYTFRVYDAGGIDYFVKRVIGVPGDTVKIENGRVYVKGPNEADFTEIEENFLNQENYQKTYISQKHRTNVYTVPEGHYFVMGDNRNHSNDSRSWLEPVTGEPYPFVPESNISGKVLIVLWPVGDLRFISSADF